jgi:hypothetical protein
MAAVEGNDRALLVARAGCARAKASRAGFVSEDVDPTNTEFYMWTNQVGMTSQEISTVWTSEVT